MENYSVGILGAAHTLPDNIQTNEQLCELMEDVTPDWILSKTGIKQRYVASPTDSTSQMSTDAARKLLVKTGISSDQIGLIIVNTCTPDYIWPPVSAKVQGNLQAKNAEIIDIKTCCTGIIPGLTIASDRMKSDLDINYALVIGAEIQSRYVNYKNKSALFCSDGAAAVLLGPVSVGAGIINSVFFTDSSNYESVRLRGGGSSFPYKNRDFSDEIDCMEMNGLVVWRQAVTHLPVVIQKVCDKSKINITDIDFFIFHQANSKLIEYLMAKMNIPMEKTYTNVQEIGNTSSASVGIALSEAMEKNYLKQGDLLLLAGIGAGFNFSANLWKL
jgi:3-oxoacyl-[acyl-carrier-protein] synthase-3